MRPVVERLHQARQGVLYLSQDVVGLLLHEAQLKVELACEADGVRGRRGDPVPLVGGLGKGGADEVEGPCEVLAHHGPGRLTDPQGDDLGPRGVALAHRAAQRGLDRFERQLRLAPPNLDGQELALDGRDHVEHRAAIASATRRSGSAPRASSRS